MKVNDFKRIILLGIVFCLMPGFALAAEETKEQVNYPEVAQLAVPYEDAYTGSVLPSPREIQVNEGFLPLYDLNLRLPKACIVVPGGASDIEKLAAVQLSIQPSYLADPEKYFTGQSAVSPLPIFENSAPKNFAVVISLGIDLVEGLSEEDIAAIDTIKGSTEGYVIRQVKKQGQTRVLCYGPNPIGNFHAVQTLRQLITKEEDAVVLKDVLVGDWPHFPLRGIIHEGAFGFRSLQFVDSLAEYKLNMFAFGGWLPDWRNPDERYLAFVQEICGKCESLGTVTANFMVRPYKGKAGLDININDSNDVQRLVDLFQTAVDAGAGAVTLRADDLHGFKPVNKEHLKALAAAHFYLVNYIYEELTKTKPDLAFFFMSPYYRSIGAGAKRRPIEEYLTILGENLHPEIEVLWTGLTTRSLWISEQDLEGYSSTLGRTPVLWDNTLYAHKSQYVYDLKRPHYLFDTFATNYPKSFMTQLTGALYNGGDSEVYRVGRLNNADFLWNPSAYDPNESLKTALAKVSGNPISGSDYLLDLRRLFYDFYDVRFSGIRMTQSGRDKVIKNLETLPMFKDHLEETVENAQLKQEVLRQLNFNDEFIEQVQQVQKEFEPMSKNIIGKIPMQADAWIDSSSGGWNIKFPGEYIQMINLPMTHSPKGSKAEISVRIKVPQSPTDRYYLLISAGDDHLFDDKKAVLKQVFIDDELVWEESIKGDETLMDETFNFADITSLMSDREEVVITLRTIDTQGVISLWANVFWGDIHILSSPFPAQE